jgi:hypothetical protein
VHALIGHPMIVVMLVSVGPNLIVLSYVRGSSLPPPPPFMCRLTSSGPRPFCVGDGRATVLARGVLTSRTTFDAHVAGLQARLAIMKAHAASTLLVLLLNPFLPLGALRHVYLYLLSGAGG